MQYYLQKKPTYFKKQFEELALQGIKELANIIKDEENRPTQLQGIKYALEQAGITGKDQEPGTIEIKVRLPNDL